LDGVATLIAIALLLQQEEKPPAPPPVVMDTLPLPWIEQVHGRIRLLNRSRWTGDDSDSDLFSSLAVWAGDPEKDLFSGSATGRLNQDWDGDRHREGFYAFDSLSDSYKKATTGQLYTAYVNIANPWPGVRARAGRQIIEELPEAIPMDGAKASYDATPEITVAAFGGAPVNYFESSTMGDWMFGGWIEGRPWSRGRARLEYLHLEDENTFGLFRDDLIGLSMEHGEGPWLLSGRMTILESEGRDILLRGTGGDPESGLTVDVRLYYLFEQQQALSYALDGYVVFLVPIEPYYQLTVSASHDIGPNFGVDAALAVRRLEDSSDEADYNHEFSRWSFTGRSRDWPGTGWSVSLTGDFWQTSDDDFWTVSGGVGWEITEDLKADLSSSYSLYMVDAITGEERERVRLASLGVRWKMNADVFADGRFTAEDNDIDDFRSFDVGIRYAF
jgi:hypothetical protein